MAVAFLALDGRPIGLAGDAFGAGWHEGEAAWRWTDGDAVLHPGQARQLTVTLAMTERYWLAPAEGQADEAGFRRQEA